MLSRVADAIFWMNRYVERSVAASRLVDVTLHLQLDAGNMHETWDLWNPKSVIACIVMAREAARGVRDSLSRIRPGVDGSGSRRATTLPSPRIIARSHSLRLYSNS